MSRPAEDARYPSPLRDGVLVGRRDRFLVDVALPEGTVLTAHCANSGSMRTCLERGRPVRCSDSGSPTRVVRWTWEQIDMGRGWVGVNTAVPNRAVAAAVARDGVEALRGYPTHRREVPYGRDRRSRIDLLLSDGGRRCWVEVKNSSMAVGTECRFPDSPTERGRKHLEDLAERVEAGDRAVLVFFVHRPDVDRFRPAWEIDPAYAAALTDAVTRGVEVLPLSSRLSARGVTVGPPLPFALGRPPPPPPSA